MIKIPANPKKADFTLIPGTTGVVGSGRGIVVRMTSSESITDWGQFYLRSAMFSEQKQGIQSLAEAINTIVFEISEDDIKDLTPSRMEIYDIVWERDGVKESFVRGKLTVGKGVEIGTD